MRIQKDRGHTVVTGGPYRYVRHPGYVEGIMFQLGTPSLLGSLWALIPAGLMALLLVVRTALEDRTLQNELEAHREYAQQPIMRLLPGVWRRSRVRETASIMLEFEVNNYVRHGWSKPERRA